MKKNKIINKPEPIFLRSLEPMKDIELLNLIEQPVRYFVVLDFEATCEENKKIHPQEVIEFPSVVIDTQTLQFVKEIQIYVKPNAHPKLSKFCTDLTGITQDIVDNGVSFVDSLKCYDNWIKKLDDSYAFVTCGDWDLKTCLPNQCKQLGIKKPNYFNRWVNIKQVYESFYNKKRMGMTGMLEQLNLALEGRHHSGLDDCRNIARILRKMLQDGVYVTNTTKYI